jgi:DNA-binding PadR family transcriptional regulator
MWYISETILSETFQMYSITLKGLPLAIHRIAAPVMQRSGLLVGLTYATFISMGLSDGFLGIAWPSIRDTFGLPLAALGALSTTITIGALVTSFSIGHLLARLGVVWLLTASCLAMAVSLHRRLGMEVHAFDPPLSPVIFAILLALSGGARHQYGIMKQVDQDSHGLVHIGGGAFQAALTRLLKAGLIDVSGQQIDVTLNTRVRTYYELTPQGRQALSVELARYEELVAIGYGRNLLTHSE